MTSASNLPNQRCKIIHHASKTTPKLAETEIKTQEILVKSQSALLAGKQAFFFPLISQLADISSEGCLLLFSGAIGFCPTDAVWQQKQLHSSWKGYARSCVFIYFDLSALQVPPASLSSSTAISIYSPLKYSWLQK